MIEIAQEWKDYELLDAGEREKLERWGKYILRRPDPQAIWSKNPKIDKLWNNIDLYYHRSSKGGGYWENFKNIPENWTINYKDLTFGIKPTAFKHTGLFPEQASNWEWFSKIIKNSKSVNSIAPNILNLFAYTGGATVAAAGAGAHVCHVDASQGMTNAAKENLRLSNISNIGHRFIVDDVVKFVQREIKRGNKYEGIIMDPPAYGRGPTGELWEIETKLEYLVQLCTDLLSKNPLFILVNAYATSFSSLALGNILKSSSLSFLNGKFTHGELALSMSSRDLSLPCGLFARWELIKT